MNTELLQKLIYYKAVSSSGLGGHNVNKVATPVQLYFDVLNSLSFANAYHERIKVTLNQQLTKEGI